MPNQLSEVTMSNLSAVHKYYDRKLGTPTSSDWPAVEQLPHYDLLPTANYPLRLISSIITLESEDAYLVDVSVMNCKCIRMRVPHDNFSSYVLNELQRMHVSIYGI